MCTRSLDGTAGPLTHDNAHDGILALVAVEHEGQPLIVSAGGHPGLRSWRLDGTPGPLTQDNAHEGAIWALAAVEHEGQSVIVSAGDDAICSSTLHAQARESPGQCA